MLLSLLLSLHSEAGRAAVRDGGLLCVLLSVLSSLHHQAGLLSDMVSY